MLVKNNASNTIWGFERILAYLVGIIQNFITFKYVGKEQNDWWWYNDKIGTFYKKLRVVEPAKMFGKNRNYLKKIQIMIINYWKNGHRIINQW